MKNSKHPSLKISSLSMQACVITAAILGQWPTVGPVVSLLISGVHYGPNNGDFEEIFTN